MWKDSYKVGVESIDLQHMELFRMVDELIMAIEADSNKETFQKAIGFLKNYVVRHFADEEAYQASIQYKDRNAHKKLHRDFTKAVIAYEKKLIETDFDLKVVKNLAGTLTAWLIYHVADADQKIVKGDQGVINAEEQKSCISSFVASISDVLEKLAGLHRSNMKGSKASGNTMTGDVFVEIGLVGDIKGSAYFGFSKEMALKLIQIMTSMQIETLDEMVFSALSEFSNISSGKATIFMTDKGIVCDIKPPVVSEKQQAGSENLNGIVIQTGIGEMEIALRLED